MVIPGHRHSKPLLHRQGRGRQDLGRQCHGRRPCRRGKRVLLVSTDPASNLGEVFGVELGMAPTPVPEVANLFALNIDPEAAAHAYRERMVGPYRGVLPDASVRSMEEQFSGACTDEIAAFDEFSKLLGDASATAEFDHVIFDTAPTGHTLRLLAAARGLDRVLRDERRGQLLPGPALGPRRSAGPLRSGPEGTLRRRHDNARARQSAREDGTSRGGPLEP